VTRTGGKSKEDEGTEAELRKPRSALRWTSKAQSETTMQRGSKRACFCQARQASRSKEINHGTELHKSSRNMEGAPLLRAQVGNVNRCGARSLRRELWPYLELAHPRQDGPIQRLPAGVEVFQNTMPTRQLGCKAVPTKSRWKDHNSRKRWLNICYFEKEHHPKSTRWSMYHSAIPVLHQPHSVVQFPITANPDIGNPKIVHVVLLQAWRKPTLLCDPTVLHPP
jgi:hypothetical protein